MKSEILKQHFINPEGIGSIENPDYTAYLNSDSCNDVVKLTMNISSGVITDIMAQVNGCGFSIAGASLFIKEVKGMRFDDVPSSIEKVYVKMNRDIQDKSMNCVKLTYNAYMSIYENIRQGNK